MLKLLFEDVEMPQRATKGSAGYDLAARESVTIKPGECGIIPTGVAFKEVMWGVAGLVTPRSSICKENHLVSTLGYGLIDGDYLGEISIVLTNVGAEEYVVEKGAKIGQMMFVNFGAMEGEIMPTRDRNGGFGSTDES